MKTREVGKYLVVDPQVCFGKLTFRGTRLPVETILTWLAKGKTIDSILSDWPYLSREAVAEAVLLAAEALVERYSNRSGSAHEPVHSRRAARGDRSARANSKTA